MYKHLSAVISFVFIAVVSQPTFSQGFRASQLISTQLDDLIVDLSSAPDGGERALQKIISGIEKTHGRFEPKLYGYLSELARIQQTNGNHVNAIDNFQRMQTLTHWADGVYSPLQLESLRLQSQSYIALGQVKRADTLEKFHLKVAEKNYPNQPELAASYLRLGDWRRANQQYAKAMIRYDQAYELTQQLEMGPVAEVSVLKSKALAEHLANECCSTDTLRTVVLLNEGAGDSLSLRDAQLDAADLSLIYGEPEAKQAYQLVQSAPAKYLGLRSVAQVLQTLDRTEDRFAGVQGRTVIHVKQAPTMSFSRDSEASHVVSSGDPVRLCTQHNLASSKAHKGFVDVSVTVSHEGKAANVSMQGTAPIFLKRYLRSTLIKGVYRPEIVGGQPQQATIHFRQHFDAQAKLSSAKVSEWRNLVTEHACQLVAAR